MVPIDVRDVAELRKLLQSSVIKCSERCLYQSAKWAAELLNAMPEPELDSPTDTEVDSPMGDWDTSPPQGFFSLNESAKEARLEAAEAKKYVLAKTYFDCREYDRCTAVFLPMTLPRGSIATGNQGKEADTLKDVSMSTGFPHLSQKALFLALYAKYMSGEKRKDEESETILGPADGGGTVNRELVGISRVLEARMESFNDSNAKDVGQGWLEYLYAIVLAKGKNDKEAKKWLLQSVWRYPGNWGAWQELCSLLETADELTALHDEEQLPKGIITFIFHVYANQELFQTQPKVFDAIKRLKGIFPKSAFVRTQKALLCYHERDYEKAERIFSKIVQCDPLRLDSLDTYSNILFVMEKSPKLAFIAQLSTATDKFRPETCCVVGNYHALKSEHEKAVLYFRRALTLDRNFQSAWTLMGHEYVELRNTHAAIECYRRAVDVNRKDYRAWYGLGQTYELLEMALYSLYYYERAAAACPQDAKMWTAVGSCLSKLNRFAPAIKAYKRALVAEGAHKSRVSWGSWTSSSTNPAINRPDLLDPEILYAIAINYDRLGIQEEARAYLELTLAQEEGPDAAQEEEDLTSRRSSVSSRLQWDTRLGNGVGVTQTTSKARIWLAKMEYAKGDRGALRRAYELANELCQDGWEVDDALALIKDIRARLVEMDGGLGEAERRI